MAAYTSETIGGDHVRRFIGGKFVQTESCFIRKGIFKHPLLVTAAGVFPYVTMLGSHCFFPLRSAFFSRPRCLGLIMKNRVNSFFSSSDQFISNFNVFNNTKITLYYNVCMRTSGDKIRISDEAEHVQSVS